MKGLKNLLRLARITGPGKDDGNIPIQQMEYLGKAVDGVIVFPYGMHANVPGDTAGLMFAIEGFPENRATLPFNLKKRPTLAAGEVAFFHPLLPDLIIKLQANGEMLIKSAVKINFEAPETEFTGVVKANGKIIDDTHGHTQGDDSGGDTEAVISGVT